MATTPENAPNPTLSAPDPEELTRLRNHNAELLTDLKAAKAKVTTLQAQLTEASAARDSATKELRALKLDGPVNDLLDELAMPGTAPALAQMITSRGFRFELDSNGFPAILDAEGKPATVFDAAERTRGTLSLNPKSREAKFEAADLRALLLEDNVPADKRHPLSQAFTSFIIGSKANGGGSTGSSRPTPTTETKPQQQAPSVPVRFGLS